jgi:hypothetical protein
MANGFYGIITPYPECAYPFFPSPPIANATPVCDVTISSSAPAEFDALRIIAACWSGTLLILLVFERFVVIFAAMQRRVGFGELTTFCHQWFMIRSFKTRALQVLVCVAILNMLRAIDLRGASNMLSAKLMIMLDELVLVLELVVAMLYVASVAGTLLRLRPRMLAHNRRRRVAVTIAFVAFPVIEALLALGDGIPVIGVKIFVVRTVLLGLFFVIAGVCAGLLAFFDWSRLLRDRHRRAVQAAALAILHVDHSSAFSSATQVSQTSQFGQRTTPAPCSRTEPGVLQEDDADNGSDIFNLVEDTLLDKLPAGSDVEMVPLHATRRLSSGVTVSPHAARESTYDEVPVSADTSDTRPFETNVHQRRVAPYFLWIVVASTAANILGVAVGCISIAIAIDTEYAMPARPPPLTASLVRPLDLWTTPFMMFSFWVSPVFLFCVLSSGAFFSGPAACYNYTRSGCPNACCISGHQRRTRVLPSNDAAADIFQRRIDDASQSYHPRLPIYSVTDFRATSGVSLPTPARAVLTTGDSLSCSNRALAAPALRSDNAVAVRGLKSSTKRTAASIIVSPSLSPIREGCESEDRGVELHAPQGAAS